MDDANILIELRAINGGMSDLGQRMAGLESKITSREEICAMHRAEMAAIRKDIEGNGKPGLKASVVKIQETKAEAAALGALETRFDRFETKVLAYSAAGAVVGTVALNFMMKKMGWG